MAYLDPAFSEIAASAAFRPFGARRLDATHRRVIAASRCDTPASFVATRGFVALLRRTVSRGGTGPLADPALEALRRYAVLLRHGGDTLAADAAAALVAHGYGVDQVAHARWLVARETPASLALAMAPAVMLAALLSAAIWLGLAMRHETGETAIGLVAALFALVSCAPLVSRRAPIGLGHA